MSELKVDKVSPRSGNYVALNTVGMKNIIINGDMSIAQRGTTFTGNTTSNYMVDRFTQNINGAIGTWTNGQSTEVPTGQGFANSLIMDCTTADAAPAAADFVRVEQRFEGQNLQYIKKGTANAESLTLSFWVKSNKTGTYIAELEDRDNSRYVSKSYTVDVTDTWEFKTATFPGDTTGTLNNDNGESLRLNFWLGAGATWTSGTLGTTWHTTAANRAVGQVNLADDTSNDWYITGVQLEAGTTASDFEFLPVDVNLQRCQRYCYVITGATDQNIAIGDNANGSGAALFFLPLLTTMRSAPSGTFTTASHFEKLKYEDGWADLSSIALSTTQPFLYVIEGGSSQSDTRGVGTALRINDSSGKITLSSEL
jgi:hypothetical protein